MLTLKEISIGALLGILSCTTPQLEVTYSKIDPAIARDVREGRRGILPDPRVSQLTTLLNLEEDFCSQYQARLTAGPKTSKCAEAQSKAANLQTAATLLGYMPGVGAISSYAQQGAHYGKAAADLYCIFDPIDAAKSRQNWGTVLAELSAFAVKNPTLVHANPRATRVLSYAGTFVGSVDANNQSMQASCGQVAPTVDAHALDPVQVNPKPTSNDAAARLRKLQDLRAQGLITDEEFQKKKQAILDEM